jgi:hypothetical protein
MRFPDTGWTDKPKIATLLDEVDCAKSKDNDQMARSWRSLDKLGMTTMTPAPTSENP